MRKYHNEYCRLSHPVCSFICLSTQNVYFFHSSLCVCVCVCVCAVYLYVHSSIHPSINLSVHQISHLFCLVSYPLTLVYPPVSLMYHTFTVYQIIISSAVLLVYLCGRQKSGILTSKKQETCSERVQQKRTELRLMRLSVFCTL